MPHMAKPNRTAQTNEEIGAAGHNPWEFLWTERLGDRKMNAAFLIFLSPNFSVRCARRFS